MSTATQPQPLRADGASVAGFPIRRYEPQHQTWPYKPSDFKRYDETPDEHFYDDPRIDVQHIDDHAIANIKTYYEAALPESGRILDLCTSWTSHFPNSVKARVESGELKVAGVGLNKEELDANPHLNDGKLVHDLNANPRFAHPSRLAEGEGIDAATCVVSIDYLTSPREMLEHLRTRYMNEAGVVHLVVSNRRFPTKAIAMWERASEEERLQIVGDYLHFSGWKNIEIVDLSGSPGGEAPAGGLSSFLSSLGMRSHDPLWVVRGRQPESLHTGSSI